MATSEEKQPDIQNFLSRIHRNYGKKVADRCEVKMKERGLKDPTAGILEEALDEEDPGTKAELDAMVRQQFIV